MSISLRVTDRVRQYQLDGKDLRNLPIEERKAKLNDLLEKTASVIRYSVSFTKDHQRH